MKKLAIILSFFIFTAATCQGVFLKRAYAENYVGRYAQVISDDCAFFSEASLKIVKFYIPKSYCVKIVSVGVESSRAVYLDDTSNLPKAEGYVLNVCLNFLDEKPDVCYPEILLTVISDEVIFGDFELKKPKAVIGAGSTANFYGETLIGSDTYEYVYVNGYVGYMRKAGFSPFSIPENPIIVKTPNEVLDKDTESSFTHERENGDKNLKVSEVLIIAVMVVAGLTLIFFILKPNKDQKRDEIGFSDD